MGLFSSALGLIRRTAQTAQLSTALISQWLANTLWLIETTFLGLARKGYGQSPVVYACLRLLSQSVPEPPLLAYAEAADGSRAPLDRRHPLQQLIARPNELLTEYEFWELTTLYLGICGHAHWWKERDRAGRVIALWPLRPDRVGPIYSTLTDPGARVVKGWSYQVPGTAQYLALPREDVVTFNLPDPAGESGGLVEGLGPLQVLAAEVSADNEATRFVGALVANYAQPSLLIKTKVPIKDEDTARLIKAAFKSQFGGSHRGEPALLDGDSSIEQLSFNLRELEFPNLRDVAESRIAAAFGVPAILVGLKVGLQSGIRATIKEQRAYFAETTLANYWRRFSDQYTLDVAAEFGPGLVCAFDTSRVLALADVTAQQQQPLIDAFAAGAITVNEFRTLVLHLPERPDGDTLGKAAPPAPPALPPGTPDAQADAPGEDGPGGSPPEDAPPARKAARPRPDPAAAQTAATEAEDRLAATATPALHAALDQLGETYASRLLLVSPPTRSALRADGFAAEEQRFLEAVLEAEPEADLRPLGQALLDAHTAGLGAGFAAGGEALGLGLSFAVTNPRVQDVLGELGGAIRGIDATTRGTVRDVIGAGLREGQSVQQLAAALRASTAWSQSRAETIARTESATAYNRGAALAYAEGGVKRVLVADGTGDGLCSPYADTEQSLAWFAANPKAHPRCTRAAAPIPEV